MPAVSYCTVYVFPGIMSGVLCVELFSFGPYTSLLSEKRLDYRLLQCTRETDLETKTDPLLAVGLI